MNGPRYTRRAVRYAIFSNSLWINMKHAPSRGHNHPSGNLCPSEADQKITRKIVDAGKLLVIAVLDHLIMADDGFYSFADEGAL